MNSMLPMNLLPTQIKLISDFKPEKRIFRYLTNKQALMCFTFIGGFMDTASYLLLDGLFASSITGNIVIAVQFKKNEAFVSRLLVVMFIGFGSWITTMYSMKLRYADSMSKHRVGMRLLLCEFLALLIALIVGSCLEYPSIVSSQLLAQASLMAFSMGVQNATAMIVIPNCPVTTAMTGNTIRFCLFGAEAMSYALAANGYLRLFPGSRKPEDYDRKMAESALEMKLKFRTMFSSLIPFCLGCVVCVPIANSMGMVCLIIPCLIIFALFFAAKLGSELNELHIAVGLHPLSGDDKILDKGHVNPMQNEPKPQEVIESYVTEESIYDGDFEDAVTPIFGDDADVFDVEQGEKA